MSVLRKAISPPALFATVARFAGFTWNPVFNADCLKSAPGIKLCRFNRTRGLGRSLQSTRSGVDGCDPDNGQPSENFLPGGEFANHG